MAVINNINGLTVLYDPVADSDDCIVYVHGGPGYGLSVLGAKCIEKMFPDHCNYVLYDQRASGKSISLKSLIKKQSIEEHEEDLLRICEFLFEKYERIILVCHSWGTIIGLRLFLANRSLPLSYIGVGQVVNGVKAEKYLYSKVCSEADKQGIANLISKYDGPILTNGLRNLLYLIKSRKMAMALFENNCNLLEEEAKKSSNYEFGDEIIMKVGFANALLRLWDDCLLTNFDDLPSSNPVDMCLFVTGSHDVFTPPYLVDNMIEGNSLFAGSRHLIVKNAGHKVHITHPNVIRKELKQMLQ